MKLIVQPSDSSEFVDNVVGNGLPLPRIKPQGTDVCIPSYSLT